MFLRRFPFNQNVRFEFSAISISERNSGVFQNFQKRGQPRKVYPNFEFFSRNFSSIQLCSWSFYNCFVEEWFAFRKLKKLFGEIAVLLASVSKFLKGLVEWNAPSVLQFDWDERQLCLFVLHNSHSYLCCHP